MDNHTTCHHLPLLYRVRRQGGPPRAGHLTRRATEAWTCLESGTLCAAVTGSTRIHLRPQQHSLVKRGDASPQTGLEEVPPHPLETSVRLARQNRQGSAEDAVKPIQGTETHECVSHRTR